MQVDGDDDDEDDDDDDDDDDDEDEEEEEEDVPGEEYHDAHTQLTGHDTSLNICFGTRTNTRTKK